MAQGDLKLHPNDFWDDPWRTREDIEQRLLSGGVAALLVDAPPEVPLDRRDTAPLLVLRVASYATVARFPFDRTAVVAAVDLDNNYLYAAAAAQARGPDRGEDTRPPPPGPAISGTAVQGYALELRGLLGLPWKPARYLVTLILQETTHDRLPVRLGNSPATYHDPEVDRYLNELRKQPDVPALVPDPRERMRPFAPHPQAPTIPAEKGMNLSVRRVIRTDDPDPVVLRCSFRLPVLRRHVVPPGADPWNPATAALFDQLGENDTPPRGVVRIGLVATGSVVATPFVWRLAVPTYDPIPPGDGPVLVTGSFRVDLQSLGNVKGVEQTLFLYAFSDDVLVGPIPIGVTAEPLIK
jgi:hypothetical protein